MKIKITASSSYDTYQTIQHGRQKFSVHIDTYDENDDLFFMPRFSMSEIHPYDDAEYTWARRSDDISTLVLFAKGGKIVDRMTIHDYDSEYYESPSEYVDDILDSVAIELMTMNKGVEPRMVHN